jgi:hypothetical protein
MIEGTAGISKGQVDFHASVYEGIPTIENTTWIPKNAIISGKVVGTHTLSGDIDEAETRSIGSDISISEVDTDSSDDENPDQIDQTWS